MSRVEGVKVCKECLLYEETHQRLWELVEQHAPEGWRLKMHDVVPGSERALGATEHETKTIHMKMDCGWKPEEAVKTVLHEIAHALLPESELHSRRWAKTLIGLDGEADRHDLAASRLYDTLVCRDTELGQVPEELREYYRFCFCTADLDRNKIEGWFPSDYLARVEELRDRGVPRTGGEGTSPRLPSLG